MQMFDTHRLFKILLLFKRSDLLFNTGLLLSLVGGLGVVERRRAGA